MTYKKYILNKILIYLVTNSDKSIKYTFLYKKKKCLYAHGYFYFLDHDLNLY